MTNTQLIELARSIGADNYFELHGLLWRKLSRTNEDPLSVERIRTELIEHIQFKQKELNSQIVKLNEAIIKLYS